MQRIRKKVLTLAVAASLLLGASISVTPATAAPVTFEFSGPVFGFSGADGSDLYFTALGSPSSVSGSFSFDSTNVPTGLGTFNDMITAAHVQIGSYTATLVPPVEGFANEINVSQTVPGLYNYVMQASINDLASNFSGFTPYGLKFEFVHAPEVFTGDSTLPSLSTVGTINPIIRVVFLKNVSFPEVLGAAQNITTVPLPPAVILFGAGLIALIGLGARNWQRTSGVRLEV